MAKLLQKAYQFLLGTEYDEGESYVDEYDEAIIEEEVKAKNIKEYIVPRTQKKKNVTKDFENDKIVRIHSEMQMELVVTAPTSVEDSTMIVDFIRNSKACVVNLEGMDREQAQRVADFLSGAVYALEGDIQRINNDIFVVASSNINISGKVREEIKASGHLFPWLASR